MRYPEDEIKEAILHPNLEIRNRAVTYFSKSFSSDLTIMPLVINAVETYGRQNDAYRLIGASRDLQQSENTIAWVIDELNDKACKQYRNYAYNLSMVLVQADVALLLPRESDILDARHFLGELRTSLTERLRMLSWDEATCWQRLEEFCEKGKDKRYTNEVNLGYAGCIVEALARFAKDCEGKVRAILSHKVKDQYDPMKWMEPMAVRLAGEAHLDALSPVIVAKLAEDRGGLCNEWCAEALTKIGTSAVLEAIAAAFPTAERHFRLYATGPLERIHSDLAVEKCIGLFAQEKDPDIQRELALALLNQFAHEGIAAARQLLMGEVLGFGDKDLRNTLLRTCTLTGERFPEYEEWLEAEKAEKERHWQRVKELEGDPRSLVLYAMEKLTGKKTADVPNPRPPVPPAPVPPASPQTAPRQTLPNKPPVKKKIGRNDPCPCGSGKKFKTCCMRT